MLSTLFLKEREIYKEKESSLSLLAAWISCDTISVSNTSFSMSSASTLPRPIALLFMQLFKGPKALAKGPLISELHI